MKIFKPLIILLCAALLLPSFLITGAQAVEYPEVGASAVVLVEAETGQVLYSKNENARKYPASLTKVMTALLAVEACETGYFSLSDEVTASENCRFDVADDSSTANIVPGETMTLEDLLYCALVKSANEACNIIAEYIGGSVSGFVEMMNDKARELGCSGTRFVNTHGYHDEGHYTTAWDFYLICREAASYSTFMDICNTAEIELEPTNVDPVPRVLTNTNALLIETENYTGYKYSKARGIKTGHTSAAGYCLASSATDGSMNLIAIVMDAVATETGDSMHWGHFADSITLYDWAFDNFSYQDILKTTEHISTIPIAMGSGTDTVSVRPETAISALLPNDMSADSFTRDIVIYSERDNEELSAPISAGSVLGEITVSYGGVTYGKVNLVATSSIDLSKTYYIRTEIEKVTGSTAFKVTAWVLVLLFLLYLALVIRYRVLRIRHVRSVRQAQKNRMEAMTDEPDERRRAPVNYTYDRGSDDDEDDGYFTDYGYEDEDGYDDEPPPPPSSRGGDSRDYYEEFFK